MADEKDARKGIKTNPLVARLLEAGSDNAITLTGFVAPAGRPGYIRLFTALNDLSRSIEIAESDILATADLPKSGLGAVALWVKRDAPLQLSVTKSAASCAMRTQAGELSEVRRGGLRMKVRPQSRDTCTCEYFCDGTQCVPCTCNCLAQ